MQAVTGATNRFPPLGWSGGCQGPGLHDDTTFTFQEATIANLARAYIAIKTHPRLTKMPMSGRKLDDRKEGYAAWQLMEE